MSIVAVGSGKRVMEKVVRPVEILIFLTHVHPLGSNSLSKALPLELGTLSTPRSALGDGGGQDRIFCSPGRGLAGGGGDGGSGGIERAGEAAAEGAAGRGGGHPGGREHGEIARPADCGIEGEAARRRRRRNRCEVWCESSAREEEREAELIFIF